MNIEFCRKGYTKDNSLTGRNLGICGFRIFCSLTSQLSKNMKFSKVFSSKIIIIIKIIYIKIFFLLRVR